MKTGRGGGRGGKLPEPPTAAKALISVNLAIREISLVTCWASSRELVRQIACGVLRLGSTRLSIVRAKAAVLPVPDCDWAIMLLGLPSGPLVSRRGRAVS